eukprot:COSAG06_NODE_6797_length_2777_cov_45.642644_4_plen_77_part_01
MAWHGRLAVATISATDQIGMGIGGAAAVEYECDDHTAAAAAAARNEKEVEQTLSLADRLAQDHNAPSVDVKQAAAAG